MLMEKSVFFHSMNNRAQLWLAVPYQKTFLNHWDEMLSSYLQVVAQLRFKLSTQGSFWELLQDYLYKE